MIYVDTGVLVALIVPEPHSASVSREATFWLTPEIAVATATGLSPHQLREAQAIVAAHIQEIQDAWHRHFRA